MLTTRIISLLLTIAALAPPVFAITKPTGTFSSSGATSSGIYANSNLRGVLIRASWSDIEPTPGTFNFNSIALQVANAKANGKPWSLAVIGGGTGSPAWLTNPAASGGLGVPFITYSFRGVPGYKLPLFWNSIVQTRLTQLANALAAQYNNDADLKLVYVTQMTSNGIEGHLQGVTMSTLIAAGDNRDGDSDVDAADFQIAWIDASKQASRSFAYAFTNKALAFEVHDVNNTATIPEIIINDLWNDPTLGQRVGAAMWWISGKTSYQPALVTALTNFPGDIYGQVIGKSNEGPWLPGTSYLQGTYRMPVNPPATNRFRYEVTTAGVTGSTEPVWPTTINATVTNGSVVWTCRDSRFQNGDFATVFAQAKAIGMRYIEPWEWEFKYGNNSANGEWDTVLADFNAWADATYGNTAPTITSIANQTTTVGVAEGPLSFTVGDAQTAAGSLTVTGSSSNTTLLPNANITFGGSGASRTVTLTPASGQSGTSTVTLTVSDGVLTAQTSFTLTVSQPLPIGGGDPPAPLSGSSYSHTFTATGATGAVTWTLASGALPPGLTLSSGGVLSGTPTTPGAYNFTVQATDSLGLTGTQNVTLTVSGGPQTVTALAALHQNGQSYLTWNEVADTAATYRVYRSASPFTSTAQLSSANLLGTAAADSSFDSRLSAIRGTNYFYRITAAGPDLIGTQGLFVHTPVANGAGYYAVTAVISGVEQLALVAGQSATAAVNETVAMPEPVFQRSFTITSRTVETYVHWVGAVATAFYPAMGNQNSVAHHLGLVRRGAASTHSLLIRPHARMGSFLSTVTGTSDADEWVLTLDDWMPNSIQNTFWYGYHEAFDINTGLPQPATGTVHDYTTRRAQWEIEWALRTLPLDLNRVYMTGHSMGGIGSHFLSLMLPGKIAAIWTTSAKYDFSFLNDPNPANIWNSGSNERAASGDLMWGTVATDLMSSEGVPVYDRLNAGYLAAAFRSVDQPVMIAFHGKNDTIVGWAEKLGFYNAMNANRHGGMFFFDSAAHSRTGGEWVPQQSVNVLNRYRLDQSYPAFSGSTANGNPGDGNATNGDVFGTINGNLDWDTASIVDTASQWQIRLLTVPLTSTTGTVAAPASATADVTPRRLQAFDHTPGRAARYEVRDAGNALLKQGLVVADADGLYTVPAVPITPVGATLTLTTVFQDAPAIASVTGGYQLTWPTTVGVRYQVEWNPDLAQWFPIGTATPASGSAMTWTDNGSQTGTAPGTVPKRFYRLRISEP